MKTTMFYEDKNGELWCRFASFCLCKDCAYVDKSESDDGRVWCNYHDTVMREDDFCSCGKDKQGECSPNSERIVQEEEQK